MWKIIDLPFRTLVFFVNAITWIYSNEEEDQEPAQHELPKFAVVFTPDQRDLQQARVRHVQDGDSVIVLHSGVECRIRLSGIDSPEDGQEWGEIATASLVKMIGGRNVFLKTYGTDVYGRLVATIYVQRDGKLVNVNERMVMLGHAWVTRKYYGNLPPEQQRRLNDLERWAKSKKMGLWKLPYPMAPWTWRRQRSA